VTPKDVVYDLGSGDGRIVIMAAQKFGAHAVGVELDPGLYHKSWARIEELGLTSRAKILYGNMFQANVRPATVVTLYLLPGVNEDIRPMLEKQLRPGTRVVSHDFRVAGWDAVKSEDVKTESGSVHTIYLYIRP
jgi:predicted RNA methylase